MENDLMAAEIVAQVWCEPKNSHKIMDVDIANSFIKILKQEQYRTKCSIHTAQQFCSNQEYYKGILVKIATLIGEEAYISDDGTLQRSPLVSKLPDLVAKLINQNK